MSTYLISKSSNPGKALELRSSTYWGTRSSSNPLLPKSLPFGNTMISNLGLLGYWVCSISQPGPGYLKPITNQTPKNSAWPGLPGLGSLPAHAVVCKGPSFCQRGSCLQTIEEVFWSTTFCRAYSCWERFLLRTDLFYQEHDNAFGQSSLKIAFQSLAPSYLSLF